MKQKFKSAKHAREARELAEDWERMLASHSKTPFGTTGKLARSGTTLPDLSSPRRFEAASFVTPGGSTDLATAKVYTGSKMLGIGQLHKSNAQPIFSSEEAVSIAQMRR